MEHNNIRLICSDIDGTLVRNDKTLSDENIREIRRVTKQYNIPFVIVTGRMLTSIMPFYRAIDIKGPASCLNGTLLYDENGEVIIDHRINKEIANLILKAKEIFGLDMLAIALDDWYTERRSGYLYEHKLKIYQKDSIVTNFSTLIEERDMNKFLFMSENRDVLETVKNYLRANISGNDITLYSGQDFLEIMPGGINKATGIRDLEAHYGIKREEMMALGDDENDIEMLSSVGYSVAMGNALDRVKNVARYITDTNENDGVAKALLHYFS